MFALYPARSRKETRDVKVCCLCQERPSTDACYVRRDGVESASCRRCWEQVFLAPRYVLAALQAQRLGRAVSGSGSQDS